MSTILLLLLPLYLSVCSCQRTRSAAKRHPRENLKWLPNYTTRVSLGWLINRKNLYLIDHAVVGLTGLEPVTLRLSSACSNQLSYRPGCLTRLPGSGLTKGTLRFLPLEPIGNNLLWHFWCTNERYFVPTGRYLVEAWGFEPQTYSLQSYRSTS